MLSTIDTATLQVISTHQAWHYKIIPFEVSEKRLAFYTPKEQIKKALQDELELLFGKEVFLKGIEPIRLQKELAKYYRRTAASGAIKQAVQQNQDAFLDFLLEEARSLGCSDIHIEIFEEKSRVRFRIDGVMIERYQLEKENYPGLVNKLKIKSQLDIAEKRLPQDGRIFYEHKSEKIDIRISTLPTLHGEKVVLRLLAGKNTDINIEQLGFQPEVLSSYLQEVKRPNGMILISGPTGSGKTTTLYATLQELNQTTNNILTIEDPVEYTLEGINQVQLKESIGLNFASTLRTFLRQDPDIIMVGEIRDQATAAMAIRASLTGHLVLSTLHTNSAWGIIARLIDMGIPGYLIADTLNAAVSQRLVRLLCSHCKLEKAVDHNHFPSGFKARSNLKNHFISAGCEACHFTGYKGRKAVYELIPIDSAIAEFIKKEELNIQSILKEKKIKTMSDNAYQLYAKGLTSLEEIYPILSARR